MATDITTFDPSSIPISPTREGVLLDSDRLYEEIDGELVEAPPMSFLANKIASRLSSRIDTFAESNDLGFTVVEGAFRMPAPMNRTRRPDLSFVSQARWPKSKPIPFTCEALEVTPELMVEVISPTNLVDEVMDKLAEYFQAGAVHVWLIYPTRGLIQIFDRPTSSRWLNRSDVLEDLPFLPGFRLSLTELFPEPAM